MAMKLGAINIKTIIVVVVLILVGVLAVLGVSTAKTYMSGASADMEPKNVAAVPGEEGRSAVISWTSDKATAGVVQYGTTPASLLLTAIETDAVTSHKVSLSPLKPGITYYYRIKVGEDVYDNAGIPYSFKTKPLEAGSEGVNPPPQSNIPPQAEVPPPTVSVVPTVAAVAACNRTTDYNSDGVINSVDFATCLKNSKTNGPTGTVPTPTVAVAGGSPTPTGAVDCNKVDFDGNGIINSVDRIKCLQSQR